MELASEEHPKEVIERSNAEEKYLELTKGKAISTESHAKNSESSIRE